jgi:molecular chaperone GrpE
MAKKEKAKEKEAEEVKEETPETAPSPEESVMQELQEKLAAEHEAHLRLAAEYDNFRKRTQKEKDGVYATGKADAIAKFLPVYDNLVRALAQETQDAAFKKGVEMILAELNKILEGLDVQSFGDAGDAFDPELHNAIMHTEDPELGESVLSQVFQRGFKLGDRVIRFAMVQVAN